MRSFQKEGSNVKLLDSSRGMPRFGQKVTDGTYVLKVSSQGDEFLILSPNDPTKMFFQFSKRDVQVVGSAPSQSLPAARAPNLYIVKINPNAICKRVQICAFADILNDFQTASVVEDEPVALSSSRVTKAKELQAGGAVDPKGCSGLVSAALGVVWEDANSLMGGSPTLIGDNNSYPGLVPGDVVGWKVGGGSGHVAIYIGDVGTKFIDVREPRAAPRRVVNGYGNGRPLFKSSKY